MTETDPDLQIEIGPSQPIDPETTHSHGRLVVELDPSVETPKPTVELTAPNGEKYSVFEGLPEELATDYSVEGAPEHLVYSVPNKPHVFTSDRFELTDPQTGQRVLSEKDLKVLYMHGAWDGKNWAPEDAELSNSGVTIPELVRGYEEASGTKLDAIMVCKTGSTDNELGIAVKTYLDGDYIYPSSGTASGLVQRTGGEIITSMNVNSPDGNPGEVEYQGWKGSHASGATPK